MSDTNRGLMTIFGEALERTDSADRAAYLDRIRGVDAALRARVEELLAAHAGAGGFLEPAVTAASATVAVAGDPEATATHGGTPPARRPATSGREGLGTAIAGRYTLVEVIGEGGMGNVYLASQTEPVKRQVALKLIRAGLDSKVVLARFDAERQALALMNHPNIARIYDGGVTPGGQPFFVMELVNGVPLTEYCDSKRLTVDARLQLFVAVCQAVQHAHQKGIIHRDLKPSNVLVTEVDGRPTPKVIDFGVAKATEQKLTDQSYSDTGAIVGTPAYMSPEQADPTSMDIDTRTDVYALGVMLYELLTGSPPIDGKQFNRGAILEMLRMVREVEPPRPSTKLSTARALPNIAANRSIEPSKLAELLRGELDWVVMKTLEKDRTRRYDTANGLARDIQRYLADEVVEARPPSTSYRLRKFVKRNPLQLATAGMAAVLVLGGVSVAWWQTEQAGARREADLRRQVADEQRASADAARLARNAEAVAGLLGRAEEALKAGDAAKAAVVLEAATKRSAEGGADAEAERLKRLGEDLALLRDLDAIDQFRWTVIDNRLPDQAVEAMRTREALKRFGADPDAVSVDEAAARVSASVVRERIVSALDRLLRQERTAAVRGLLRRVDADPYRDAVRDAVIANDLVKIAELAGQKAAQEQPPGFVVAFMGADNPAIATERRRQLLESAAIRRPGDLGLLMTLGVSYPIDQKERADEKLRWFQAAIAAAPANGAAHVNLGIAQYDKGKVDEAIYCWRKAILLDPRNGAANLNLGIALRDKSQLDEAIAHYQKAIELDPNFAPTQTALGVLLKEKGRTDEGIACYQKAIALDPNYAEAHMNLGVALTGKGRVNEGIACYQKAIALDPKNAITHTNLGLRLFEKGQLDEAIACYQKALELSPKYANARVNLGSALAGKGRLDEAIDCFKKSVELDPKHSGAHSNLGVILMNKGRLDEAIACFQRSVELDPKLAQAHGALGEALLGRGRYAEARDASARAVALLPEKHPMRPVASRQVQVCERMLKLEGRLPRLLRGEDKADSAQESVDLARMCRAKRLHAAAARFWTEAFDADPKLVSDLQAQDRYNAACSAALAAAGKGEDAAKLEDAAKAKLCGQALDWLQADLAALTKLLGSGPPQARPFIVQTLDRWQKDTDLAGLRAKGALAELSPNEQTAFTQL